MKAESGPPIVIGIIVLATIAAGIWSVGGPATGKQEKRDKARMSDVRNLSGHVICLAYANDKVLPDALPSEQDTIADCTPAPRMADPFTQAPYVYEKISDTAYRICAGFEHPELIAYPKQMDVDAGCMNYQYKR